jgi:polar amino acid transport system substrate-binding protein
MRVLGLILLSCLLMQAQAETTITLANGEWAPFQSKSLKHSGFASYIVERAFQIEGIRVIYKFRPWKRAYEESKDGILDGSLIWRKNPEREKYFYFSNLLIASDSVMFHLKSMPFTWHDNKQLVKYKIGGTIGYQYSFDNVPNIYIERERTDKQSFSKLLLHRIQLFALDKLVGYDILNKHFSKAEINKITYSNNPHGTIDYYLMLNKKNPKNTDMLKIFNMGLKKLRDSGEYQTIIDKQLKGDFLLKNKHIVSDE